MKTNETATKTAFVSKIIHLSILYVKDGGLRHVYIINLRILASSIRKSIEVYTKTTCSNDYPSIQTQLNAAILAQPMAWV